MVTQRVQLTRVCHCVRAGGGKRQVEIEIRARATERQGEARWEEESTGVLTQSEEADEK